MKNALLRMTGMLALALLATTQVVRAQEPVLANIPFAFTAGDTALPAGEYRVEKLQQGSAVVLIRCTEGSPAVMVMTSAAETNGPHGKTKLIFHRYGNRYFLAQIWSAGSSHGRELPKSAKEKEQALAAQNVAPDQVTIVARLISPKP
ncbi:MAG TPA: hypothetical protein VNB49_11770 [Candidatus Dormibacteraeota bacterium]|nr:hypothetical protein [Candidatus Dormibacteraeota bacterium]